MRWLSVLLLVTMTLAGCTIQDQAPAATPGAYQEGDFEVRIDFDPRNVYYVGDDVRLLAEAAGDVSYVWDMGEGTQLEGAEVVHFYLAAGDYDVRVEATRADGATAAAGLTLTIQDIYASTGDPPAGAPPQGDDSGIVRVELAGDEPTEGEVARLALQAPSALSDAGDWTVWVGDDRYVTNFTSLPVALDVQMDEPGRQELLWHATIGGTDYVGNVTFDVWGTPIDFGEPTADQWLRPGVHSEVCTVNFLFHYKWYRFFIGSAAHCVDPWGPATGEPFNPCDAPLEGRIGAKESLHAHASSTATSDAWVAYESWLTMAEKGGGDCVGNDFALIELGPEAQQHMHPKALFYGGPTALAPVAGYSMGSILYGYGASNLHGNVGVAYPGQETVNSKRGVSLGTDNGGYSQHLYFALPGVPGDSGGPAFGPNGEALGAASTITVSPTPTTNRYTVIPKALEYMEAKEGWAPELITWDDWSITGA